METQDKTLSDNFSNAVREVPLADRSVIPIGFQYKQEFNPDDPSYGQLAVNFRHILDTGIINRSVSYQIPTNDISSRGLHQQHIDWNSDDAYTRALDTITENVLNTIRSTEWVQQDLAKPAWDMDTRMNWEQNLSNIVAIETAKIPGLQTYRMSRDNFNALPDNGIYADPNIKAERRPFALNDLSSDIENNTHVIEFDCEAMSITKGIIQQRVEDELLPSSSHDPGALKNAASYFYITGASMGHRDGVGVSRSGEADGHAWYMSSTTSLIFEGTRAQAPTVMPQFGVNFEKFVSGEASLAASDRFYSTLPSMLVERMGQADLMLGAVASAQDKIERVGISLEAMNDVPEISAIFENMKLLGSNDPRSEQARNDINELIEGDASTQEMLMEFQNDLLDATNAVNMVFHYAENIPDGVYMLPPEFDTNIQELKGIAENSFDFYEYEYQQLITTNAASISEVTGKWAAIQQKNPDTSERYPSSDPNFSGAAPTFQQ